MPTDLSSRERQIACLIARGMTNVEIAGDLGISPLTVKWHVSEMLRKIGVRRRLQLALHMRDLEDSRPRRGDGPAASNLVCVHAKSGDE